MNYENMELYVKTQLLEDFTKLWKEFSKEKKGEKPMICDWIKENYPKTEDADLIMKWFPHLNSHDPWGGFLVGDRTQELLELAKKLEAESKKERFRLRL